MIAPFWLIVVDRQKQIFSVEGPMTNDEQWNVAIVEEQNKGRVVHCSSASNPTREAVELSYHAQTGYKLVRPGSIIKPASTFLD